MGRPIIIDGHADTLHSIWNGSPRFSERVEGEALDIPLVKQTGLTAQFFAISTIDGGRYVEPLPRWALMILDRFHRQVEEHGDDILHATCSDDVLTARAEEFEEARVTWLQENPGRGEEYRRWFVETFEMEPPGIREPERS